MRHLALVFFLILPAALAHADVVPMDQKQLQHALQAGQPCCVIDGRGAAGRKQRPLDALPYRQGMRINPTADVVVVADDDAVAQKIAAELDAAHPGNRMIAVRGGVGTWEMALMEASRAATSGAPPVGGFGFVIPKNTCESGSPLQKLRSGKK